MVVNPMLFVGLLLGFTGCRQVLEVKLVRKAAKPAKNTDNPVPEAGDSLTAIVAGLHGNQWVGVGEYSLGLQNAKILVNHQQAILGTLTPGQIADLRITEQTLGVTCKALNELKPSSGAQLAMIGCESVVEIKTGSSHSCARMNDGTVKCWGYNLNGQLGMGDTTQRNSPPATPVDFSAGRTAVSLSLGGAHSCAILDNGSVKCWGSNSSGALGMGDTIQRNAPPATGVDLGAGRTAVSLSLGGAHSCAVLDNGSVKCWGLNTSGQLGMGDTTQRNAPSATAVDLGTGRTAVSLSPGSSHSCAVLDNRSVKCWGLNTSGQLGMGDTTQRNAPPATAVDLGAGRTAVSLSLGGAHSCAVLDNGTVKCWGSNTSGQLGDGRYHPAECTSSHRRGSRCRAHSC